MDIREDDLTGDAVRGVIRAHLDQMFSQTPAESVHALDLSGLTAPEVTFWSVWDEGEIVGCGALKELAPRHGEIKSMHTLARFRGKGYGRAMLTHILAEARRRDYTRISLETGATAPFQPAQRLYRTVGFTECGPIPGYRPDHHSLFMTLDMTGGSAQSAR